MKEAWETTEESLQDIDLQVWVMSLSQLSLLDGSLVARSSVGPPALPLRSLHGFSQVADFPFSFRRDPSALFRTSGKVQVAGRSLHEQTVVMTIVTGSSPRLGDQLVDQHANFAWTLRT